MKHIGLRTIILIFIASLLSIMVACTSSTEPRLDEVVIVATEKSNTQTAVHTNTPKPITIQTPTPLPTKTSTPTLTPTLTPMPAFTPTHTPTPAPVVLDLFESPDGEWLVSLERENGSSYSATFTFRVIRSNGEGEWIVESFGYDERSLIGYNRRVPLYWSENGEYMYFVHDGAGDGCGPSSFGYDLYRLDLQNGETVELIPEGQWFAIAPNEERVAYLLKDELVIHDLATSEEVFITLQYDPTIEYINFADLTWSSDSNSLLVFGAEDVCATGLLDEGRYFITQIDAESYLQKIIVYDSSLRGIITWTELDKAQIRIDGGYAWLNLETGEITLVDQ